MEKLLPTQLNRPPTQPRPVDPDRFRTIDVTPSNSQQDPQYQRMVADIEALQQRQGWLAGRGAFDKDDLLYLRDKEREQHQLEQHKRDAEAAAFAAARARAEQQEEQRAAAKLRQQEAILQQTRSHGTSNPVAQLSVVSIRSHKPHSQQQPTADLQQQQQHEQQPSLQQHPQGLQQQGQPPAKRQRVSDGVEFEAVEADTPQQQLPPAAAGASKQDIEPLQTLLGDYGSDDDSDDSDNDGGDAPKQQSLGDKLQLPPAAELLERHGQSSIQRPPVEFDPEVAVVGGRSSRPPGLGSWV